MKYLVTAMGKNNAGVIHQKSVSSMEKVKQEIIYSYTKFYLKDQIETITVEINGGGVALEKRFDEDFLRDYR